MKKFLFVDIVTATLTIALLLVAIAETRGAEKAVSVQTALEMWAPTQVFNGNILLVVLPQRRVTDTIYNSVISAGICFFINAGALKLPGIKEIWVLNQFQRQGWIFEGGADECRKLGQLKRKQREIFLLGKSRLF